MTILILGNVNHEYSDIGCTYDMSQIPWVPDVSADPQGIHGIDVELVLMSSTYGMDVSSDTGALYSLRPFIFTEPSIVYGLDVEQVLMSSTYGIDVELTLESVFTIGVIQKDIESSYSMRHAVAEDLLSTYGINLYIDWGDVQAPYGLSVSTDIESSYAIRERINYDLYSTYYMISELVYDLESSFDIITVNHVHRDIRAVYMLYSPASETIITDALITVNDEY